MTRTALLLPRFVAVVLAAALCTPTVVEAKHGKHGHGHGPGHVKAWKHGGWQRRLRLFRGLVIDRVSAARVAARSAVRTSPARATTYRTQSTADVRTSLAGAAPSSSRNVAVAPTSTAVSTRMDTARSGAVASFMADHPPR